MTYLPLFNIIIDMAVAIFLFLTTVATFGIWFSAGNISDKMKLLTHQRNLDEKMELCMEIMTLSLAVQQTQNEIYNLIANRVPQSIVGQKEKTLNVKQNELQQKMQQWLEICSETEKIHKDD